MFITFLAGESLKRINEAGAVLILFDLTADHHWPPGVEIESIQNK